MQTVLLLGVGQLDYETEHFRVRTFQIQRCEYVGRSAPDWDRSALTLGLRSTAEFERDVG
jgi:hypothetical protein